MQHFDSEANSLLPEFSNVPENYGVKAAGRIMKARQQQDLKEGRPKEASLFKGECVASGTKLGSGTQTKDSQTRTPMSSVTTESL